MVTSAYYHSRRALAIFRHRLPQKPVAVLGLLALCLGSAGCHQASSRASDLSPIVGTWVVKAPEAPFPLHMFVFHSDGTVEQSNPDAGDPNTSDSNAMGIWQPDGEGIKGKLVEITADRTTRQFVSRGEIAFSLKVTSNAFSGTATAIFYDAGGRRLRGPLSASLEGQRVLP